MYVMLVRKLEGKFLKEGVYQNKDKTHVHVYETVRKG